MVGSGKTILSFWDSLLAGAMFVSFGECNLVTFPTIGKKENHGLIEVAGAFVGGYVIVFPEGYPPKRCVNF